jgi:CheY-like chemotaxis protein
MAEHPRAPDPPVAAKASEEAWVVLIDDDPEQLALMAFTLERAGYRVMRAMDGWNGLVQTQSLKTGLVISDINMPGKSGPDAVRQLRSLPNVPKGLPVIFVSSMEREKALAVIPQDPLIRLVQKPVDWGKLREAIRELTGVDRPLG